MRPDTVDHFSPLSPPGRNCGLLLLTLLLSLSSCSLLDRVERLNARTYLRRSLADLSHQDRPEELTDYPLLLYPLRSLPAGEGEKLFRTADALGDTLLLELIGLRTGHPEMALKSQDKRQAMMAAALLGDTVRLRGLLEISPDPAMAYSLARIEGDTLAARSHLREVLTSGAYPPETKRLAAWALTAYRSDRAGAVEQLIRLGERGPLGEWAALLSGEPPTSDELRRQTPLLLGTLRRGSLMERSLIEDLREELWQQHLWPEALEVQQRLPDERHAQILSYEREIALLEAYEKPQEEQVPAVERESRSEGRSFVERFGPVRNVNNWAMDYGGYRAVSLSRRLTPEEYEELKQRVSQALLS
ncbi:MAG: hypothetical protein SPI16_04190 [Porphyromonas sp.]|nr:hypothetical protein [Bacteroidales bacterium]MDY6102232.1 hypothetical protein [Porphyromonas sp.]